MCERRLKVGAQTPDHSALFSIQIQRMAKVIFYFTSFIVEWESRNVAIWRKAAKWREQKTRHFTNKSILNRNRFFGKLNTTWMARLETHLRAVLRSVYENSNPNWNWFKCETHSTVRWDQARRGDQCYMADRSNNRSETIKRHNVAVIVITFSVRCLLFYDFGATTIFRMWNTTECIHCDWMPKRFIPITTLEQLPETEPRRKFKAFGILLLF